MSNDISEAMGGDFDPNSVEPTTGFDPIPAGWYLVSIDDAKVVDTKKKDGKRLTLEETVLGGDYNGRKVFHGINLSNPSTKCVEIGQRELASLGQALGLAAITDSAELLGRQVMAKVKVKSDEGRDPDNEVTAYKSADETTKPATSPKTIPPKSQAPKPAPMAKTPVPTETAKPATGKRPWER